MSVIKVIEIMASSTKSWEDATKKALAEAAKTIKGIKSLYVNEQSAVVEDNQIVAYRVNVKISFEVK